MQIIVYNPQYVNPREVEQLLRECEDKGILATTITHHNHNQKPLYIEKVDDVSTR